MLDPNAKLQLAGLTILILLQSLMEVASVGLVLPFIAMVNNPGVIDSNHFLREIRELVGADTPSAFLIAFGFGLFVLILVKNIYYIWIIRLQTRFGYGQAAVVATRLFERYLGASYEYHLRHNSADMIATTEKMVDEVFTNVVIMAMLLMTESAAVFGIVIFMVAVEPKLTLMLGAVLGSCLFVIAQTMRSKLTALGRQRVQTYAGRMRTLQQALASIKDVKVTGREPFFLAAYRHVRSVHAVAEASSQALPQLPRPILEIVVGGGIVLVMLVVLLQGRATADIVSLLALFAMGSFRILPGVNRMVYAYTSIRTNGPAVERVAKDFFDPALSDLPQPAAHSHFRFSDTIELKNVSFAYADSVVPTLKSVSLTVRRGQTIGLVGSSGAGKSTLVDLLLGLLRPQQGEVLVDGRDIARDQRAWQQLIGYVPQTISLIDDTLRNNVAFGVDTSQIDDAQVWRALALARLDGFVRTLPDGLETMLGERGVRLSGGQRQRVGLARALYRDPEVLVLDEATSALDNESERQVTEAIEALHGNKTVIVIAHRLSTVERCDRLVLLHDGAIVDDGTFMDLATRNPGFREMVRLATLTGIRPEAELLGDVSSEAGAGLTDAVGPVAGI